MHSSLVRNARGAIPLHAVPSEDLRRWMAMRAKGESEWLERAGFGAREGEIVFVPKGAGEIGCIVLGLGKVHDPLALAFFSESLPEGIYRLDSVPEFVRNNAALAWLLGSYTYLRYKGEKRRQPKLVLPEGTDADDATRIAEAVFFARDLINTPANDMGPDELAEAAQGMARRFEGVFSVITGEELKEKNYPLLHAVGRASERAPRLIDMCWGQESAPKVTLVGKGVCFDSGGLDIKSAAGMATMKKDMGGAAVALAIAQMVMSAGLRVRLRVLIPAVENSVSGNAYRPGDVLKSRKGLSIEIGNTDAEGRLVLADALCEADREKPDLLIDVATLTGAARSATGMEVPPFFTDDESLSAELMRHATSVHDPLWRLPLWRGYEPTLSSPVADLTNNPDYNLAGAITAALFLNRFVEGAKSWVHLDIPAWVDRPRPGRRKGAEANAARAIYALLKERYPAGKPERGRKRT